MKYLAISSSGTGRGRRAVAADSATSRAWLTSSGWICSGSAVRTAGRRPTRSSASSRASSSSTVTSPTSCGDRPRRHGGDRVRRVLTWRRHIIICGRLRTRRRAGRLEADEAGAVALRLQPLRDLAGGVSRGTRRAAVDDSRRRPALRADVVAQVQAVATLEIVQAIWARAWKLVRDRLDPPRLEDGLLRDLEGHWAASRRASDVRRAPGRRPSRSARGPQVTTGCSTGCSASRT